ncbi:hypothetical protein GCM10025880_20080 [Methylorubrum aminovorans]|nr:hypothetical protein GCM10025880_20080 [Methylorubrum aminovorans]
MPVIAAPNSVLRGFGDPAPGRLSSGQHRVHLGTAAGVVGEREPLRGLRLDRYTGIKGEVGARIEREAQAAELKESDALGGPDLTGPAKSLIERRSAGRSVTPSVIRLRRGSMARTPASCR